RAARALSAAVRSTQIQTALDYALSSRETELRETAQTLIGQLEMDETTAVALLRKAYENGTISEQQKVLASLSANKSVEAKQLLKTAMQQLRDDQLPPELQLDLLVAIDSSSFDELKEMKAAYEAAKAPDDVLARFRESMYGGNVEKGARIFYLNNAAQCIRCHVHNEIGGQVGPELTHIASVLSPEQLLESLLIPNARIAPGYGSVVLGLKDESKMSGVLIKEDDAQLTIRNTDGESITIDKVNIAERINAPSGMFSMEKVLDRSEIRDLMAFLLIMK
ncbi:MAG: hypothetical protein AAFO94_04060, partial [Bacteroidota bacterium]